MGQENKYRNRPKVYGICTSTENTYPVYVLSKGRSWLKGATIDNLREIGARSVRVIVEADEREAYQAAWPDVEFLTLPPEYRERYDPLDGAGRPEKTGSGPARNFALDHSRQHGDARHWVVDDNIYGWCVIVQGQRRRVGDASCLALLEQLSDRYVNVALAAHQYDFFGRIGRDGLPFALNNRVMSCILMRNDIGIRWAGRYNEDVILSMRALLRGWCSLLTYTVLQVKQSRSVTSQPLKGGNEAIYSGTEKRASADDKHMDKAAMERANAIGAKAKSLMLVREFPEFFKLEWKYNRWHHVARRKAMLALMRRNKLRLAT